MVGLTHHTATKIGTRYYLHDGARRQRERHILKVQCGVVVLLGSVQAQRGLFSITQVSTKAAVGQLLLTVHHKWQQLHLCSVIDTSFHGCTGIDRNQVAALDRCTVQRKSNIGRTTNLDHHAVSLGTILPAQAGLGNQIHILHRTQRNLLANIDPIALRDVHRRYRYANT